jgi:hypothetical protein
MLARGCFLVTIMLQCSQRALSLTSLAFGLIATGGLALAVVTDFWLIISEPIQISAEEMPGMMMEPIPSDMHSNFSLPPEMALDNYEDFPGPGEMPPILVRTHSGLWRACLIYDEEIVQGIHAVCVASAMRRSAMLGHGRALSKSFCRFLCMRNAKWPH